MEFDQFTKHQYLLTKNAKHATLDVLLNRGTCLVTIKNLFGLNKVNINRIRVMFSPFRGFVVWRVAQFIHTWYRDRHS